MRKKLFGLNFLMAFLMLVMVSSCSLPVTQVSPSFSLHDHYAKWQLTLTPAQKATASPTTKETVIPPDVQDTITSKAPAGADTLLFIHPGLPVSLRNEQAIPNVTLTENQLNADIQFLISGKEPSPTSLSSSTWVYALVAPFYTLADAASMDDVIALWQGRIVDNLNFSKIKLTLENYAIMDAILGEPRGSSVEIVDQETLDKQALTNQPFISILPFEELTPRWKVLRIDGQSPIDTEFSPKNYPLKVQIWVDNKSGYQLSPLPATNYNSDKRTVLLMTGVTALVRATANRMDLQGNTFPGTDVYPWFSAADLVHISNEVSFSENCPQPDPFQQDLIFCSSPDRIELLDYVSANIIELSGNHLLDYGEQAARLTLEMYAERGWLTYAGGWDLIDAKTPTKVSHNGNQLAFIGCNLVGPPVTWAGDSSPGAAACGDYHWLIDEIRNLRSEGYLPIVTLQYKEDYSAYPNPQMEIDFKQIADAGALIVNGSQAHTPKSMIFHEESFLHFGLGNLFFDQMEVYYNDTLMEGTREGFIDRLVFYDGQLISIELLTTMLEDYARPRPMLPGERQALLSRIFQIALDSYR